MEAAEPMRQAEDMMNPETCWQAVEERDRSRDGSFYFGVVTTGVYCRPSCPARRPLRKNVRFFRTPAEAERVGLRPCLCCRPLQEAGGDEERVSKLCRYIEQHLDAAPDLAELAARAGLSRFHLQRVFKAAVGLTPRAYADACRMRKLKQELRRSKDVTEAVYGAGYGSASRVYERAGGRLGMTPAEYRKRGRGLAITWAAIESAFGLLLVAATDRGLCFVEFGESREELLTALRREYPEARVEAMRGGEGPLQEWAQALENHLAGSRPRLDLPLDIRATAFQARVWNYLQSIPYGEVRSYAEVAEGIGAPTAVRAAAHACASNPAALAIPCHRAIRKGGAPGGYRWGLERKQALLDFEARTR
jgi:AraC family transcriptional regulator, regulatory protein of adaptative response / methylated-DNA-[protein]-cysteine methyltransferase